VNVELERTWKDVTIVYELAQYPTICLEELKKLWKSWIRLASLQIKTKPCISQIQSQNV